MQRTIITLEMQLLVKDVVDTACMKAAERASSNQPSLKVSLGTMLASAWEDPLRYCLHARTGTLRVCVVS